jgi:hypothetical protein
MNNLRMKLSLPAVYALITLTFFSCRTPSVLLNSDLAGNSYAYDVKGRQGVMIRQKLSFDKYRTVEVKRGWLKSYDFPFFIRFKGASEKLSFTLTDSLQTMHAHCLGKVKRQEFEMANSYFGIVLKEEDAFAGNLHLVGGNNWDFIVYNASNSNALNQTSGFMRSGDKLIRIESIRKMEGKNTFLSELGIYGYEFIYEDKVIGTVDTMNKGKIYIARDLAPHLQMLVAGISTALLLKTDLDT